ncbi:MAG: hypothetical protein KBD78_11330 [Oligoflexales bacterium]|nr:hypothetical protein [Oligoflexales bacterium]
MRVYHFLSLIVVGLILNEKFLYGNAADDYGSWKLIERSDSKYLTFYGFDYCLTSYNPPHSINILRPNLDVNNTKELINNCPSNNISTCLNSIFDLALPTTASPMQMTTSQYLTNSTSVDSPQNEHLGIVPYDLFRKGSIIRNKKTYYPAIIYKSGLFTNLFWKNPPYGTTMDFPLFVYVDESAFLGSTEFTRINVVLNFYDQDKIHAVDGNFKSHTEKCN